MNTYVKQAFHEGVKSNDGEPPHRRIAAGADVHTACDEYLCRHLLSPEHHIC